MRSAGGGGVGAFGLLLFLFLLLLGARALPAHPTQFTTLQIIIEPSGRYQATLNIDLLSFALGKTSLEASNEELETVLNGPRKVLGQDLEDAGTRFRRELIIHTDAGEAIPSTWHMPGLGEVGAVLARKIAPPILMPGEISFSGTLPARARQISIRLPYVLGDTVQVYELPHGRGYDEPVAAGGYCGNVALELAPSTAQAGQRGEPPASARIGNRSRATRFWILAAAGVAIIGGLTAFLRKRS